jgi:hypothetical protein
MVTGISATATGNPQVVTAVNFNMPPVADVENLSATTTASSSAF